MSAATTHTGDAGDSAASTPGFGRGLVSSLTGDGISLTTVLGNVAVNKLDDVRTNGGLEDGGDLDGGASLLTIQAVDSDNGKRCLHGYDEGKDGWMRCSWPRREVLPFLVDKDNLSNPTGVADSFLTVVVRVHKGLQEEIG